jgi:iron complex outermembrane receptor protein
MKTHILYSIINSLMIIRKTCLVVIFTTILISKAFANTINNSDYNIFSLSLEELLSIEVTTASKVEEKAFESASAIFVITNEDIIRSGVTTIPDALRMAPGIQVAQIDSNKWAITSRGFNRQYSNKLLVLFDGRSVYTPTFSGVYWDSQDYILDDIDRIEVVRGPGGTLWGENAVNGVINIITKKAKDTQGQYASLTTGNYDKFISEYRYGGETDNGNYYRIYGKYFTKDDSMNQLDGSSMNDDWHVGRSGFKYEKTTDPRTSYLLQGDVYSGKINQDLVLPVAGPGTETISSNEKLKSGNLIFKLGKQLDQAKSIDVQFYIAHEDRQSLLLNQKRTTLDLDVQYYSKQTDKLNRILGFEVRTIDDFLDSKTVASTGNAYLSYNPEKLNYQIYSFFIQDKYEIIDDKLFITLGSKFGYNEFTNFNFQPTIRASYLQSDNHMLWSSISRAVRTPTRGEDGITVLAAYSGSTALYQQGSKTYDNEDLTAYEIGYRYRKDKFSLDLTSFFNDYSNLRTQYLDGTSYIVSNYGDGKVYGFEVASSIDIKSNWRVSLAYSFLKVDTKNDTGLTYLSDNISNEGRSPYNQLSLKSYYNFSSKLQLSNMIYFSDNLTASGKDVDAYTKLDTSLIYKKTDNLSLKIVGQNLLDSRHQEFSKALFSQNAEIGRNYYFNISYNF